MGFVQCLSGVLDAIFATVGIVIIRFTIGDGNKYFSSFFDVVEQTGHMANEYHHEGLIFWLNV